jgi:hypothetical protein
MPPADYVGRRLTPVTATVEPGRLRSFQKAIGEEGLQDRSDVPPTYLFCLEMMDAANPFRFVDEIGVAIADILHADQSFAYRAPVDVGDTLTFDARVTDVFDKKNGLLTFIVQEVTVVNQDSVTVADIKRTFVVQNTAQVISA